MAPDLNKSFTDLRNQILCFNRDSYDIEDLESLMKTKELYLKWLYKMQELVRKMKVSSSTSSLWRDGVQEHAMQGGVGIYFGDERSIQLKKMLIDETCRKIDLMDRLFVNFSNTYVSKRDDGFLINGQPLELNPKTDPFILLDILYAEPHNRVVTYEKILNSFSKRSTSKPDKQTISNARDNLFIRAKVGGETLKNETPKGKKLICTIRGEGLILNNEKLS